MATPGMSAPSYIFVKEQPTYKNSHFYQNSKTFEKLFIIALFLEANATPL